MFSRNIVDLFLLTWYHCSMHITEKALRTIERFVKKNLYFPSSLELGKKMDISTQMAHRHILALKIMGLLKTNPAGRIISIVTEYPKDIQWITFSYQPKRYASTIH